MRFIAGMVSEPVVTVLAMEEPEIVPKSDDESTETLAGPPESLPATTCARSMKNWPRPIFCAITPNSTKWNTTVDTIQSVMPKMPSAGKYMLLMYCAQLIPGCCKICSGMYLPKTANAVKHKMIIGTTMPSVRRTASSSTTIKIVPKTISICAGSPWRMTCSRS